MTPHDIEAHSFTFLVGLLCGCILGLLSAAML